MILRHRQTDRQTDRQSITISVPWCMSWPKEWYVKHTRYCMVQGYRIRALVDELVEGMLAVCARLTPDDGPGRVVHKLACARIIHGCL